ncbi:MAG: rhodanese-like domain-containing protein [Saprospiraceae bacterium]
MNLAEISVHEAMEWIKNHGALLVDVREVDEVSALGYDVVHQMHIPLSVFESRFQEIPKDKKVIMACRSGARSMRATAFMVQNGWDSEEVVNLNGGMMAWSQSNFPVKGTQS